MKWAKLIPRLALSSGGLCLLALPLAATVAETPFYFLGETLANPLETNIQWVVSALLALLLVSTAYTLLKAPRKPPPGVWLAFALVTVTCLPLTPTGAAHLLPVLSGACGLLMLTASAAGNLSDSMVNLWRRITARTASLTAVRFLLLLFAFSVALNLLATWLLFDGTPHVQDGIDHLFGARLLAQGRLTAPAPPHQLAFFFPHLLVHHFEWFPQYPPGWTALLAMGVFAGVPWLVNPLLGGLLSLAFYALGTAMWGPSRGRVVGLVSALCPFLVVLHASHMSHTSALLACVAAVWQWVRYKKGAGPGTGVLAGLLLGGAFLIRPFDAMLVGIGIGADLALSVPLASRSLRRTAPGCFALACGFAGPLALFLLYHRAIAGSWFVTGYELYFQQGLLAHFVTGPREIHVTAALFANGLKMSSWLAALNKNMAQLPLPALVLLLPALGVTRKHRALLWGIPLATIGLMTLYWYGELCYGPRLLTPALVGLVPLTAAGITRLPAWLEATAGKAVARHLPLFLALAIVWGAAVQLPRSMQTYSDNYWGTVPDLPRLTETCNLQEAVVFVNSDHADQLFSPARINKHNLYNAFFIRNSPLLDSAVIWARDLGPENEHVIRVFSNRKPWKFSLGADGSAALYSLDGSASCKL
jgi:hypothetical protein